MRRHPEGGVTSSESAAGEGQEPATEETCAPTKGGKDRDGHGGGDVRAFRETGLALSQCGRGRIAGRLVGANGNSAARRPICGRPGQEVYLRLGPLRLSVFSPLRFFAAFCAYPISRSMNTKALENVAPAVRTNASANFPPAAATSSTRPASSCRNPMFPPDASAAMSLSETIWRACP